MEQLQVIGDWIVKHIIQIAFILSFVIQITPIKINPWTKIFKWIGKLITEDSDKNIKALINKTDKLESSIKSVKEDLKSETNAIKDRINENEKDRIRWEILDFANSCRNGRKHTKDEFQHIITLNDKYGVLLKKTNDKNGVFEVEYKYILYLYNRLLEKNEFLTEEVKK